MGVASQPDESAGRQLPTEAQPFAAPEHLSDGSLAELL
jgi:hypothetical protein